MFYLWKDKRSTEGKVITYITDYKEVNKDGKVWIDGHGLIDAELVLNHKNKLELISYANKKFSGQS
jgi:hypothetical protein